MTEEKSIYYFACGLEVSLRTIEWNLAHMWEIRTLWLREGNLNGENRVSFPQWIKGCWGEMLLFTIRKFLAVKDLKNLKFTIFSGKVRSMVVNTSTQRVTSIPRTIILTSFSKRSLFLTYQFPKRKSKNL